MKGVTIPGEIPRGGKLRIIIYVGDQGFARSEIYKEQEWAPGQVVYVENETTKVEFSKPAKPGVPNERYLSRSFFNLV